MWTELETSTQFPVVLNIFETEQLCRICRVPHFETGQNCKKLNTFSFEIFCLRQSWVLTCRQFSSHRRHGQDKTRHDSLVLSVSAVWNRHYVLPYNAPCTCIIQGRLTPHYGWEINPHIWHGKAPFTLFGPNVEACSYSFALHDLDTLSGYSTVLSYEVLT